MMIYSPFLCVFVYWECLDMHVLIIFCRVVVVVVVLIVLLFGVAGNTVTRVYGV